MRVMTSNAYRTQRNAVTSSDEPLSEIRAKANVYESAKAFTISVELPGVMPDDLSVTMEQRTLTVSGIRHFRNDYTTHMSRRFRIGSSIDAEQLEATLKQGLLTLVLPKSKSAQPRRVNVVVAS